MKFSVKPFVIDKKYDAELRNKTGTFHDEIKTRKAVLLTMITTFGLQMEMLYKKIAWIAFIEFENFKTFYFL